MIAVIACFFGSYLMVSFVNAEVDPYAWTVPSRLFMMVFGIIGSLFSCMFIDLRP